MASAKVYKALITLSGVTAGSINVKFGTYDSGVTLSADGSHIVYGLCSPTTTIVITPTTTFNGSIETITLVEIVESMPEMVLKGSGVSVDCDLRATTDSYSVGIGHSNLSCLIPDAYPVGAADSGGPAAPYRGINNIGIGDRALRSVVTGKYNVAIGQESMLHLTTGFNNTGCGDSALNLCASGNNNTGIGANALENLVAATDNTAIGSAAGRWLTTGMNNVYIGRLAGNVATTANSNVGIGKDALSNNVGSNSSVAIGHGSLGVFVGQPSNGWGYCTAVGMYSLNKLTSGISMIAIGYYAGTGATSTNAPVTDDYGILIGYQANRSVASATKLTNYLALGYIALADKSNQFVYGNASVTEHLFRAGYVMAPGTPTYADNAAALAGSLVAGSFYKTATGELRIVV